MNRREAFVIAVIGLGCAIAAPSNARAQDASFGCKVLLCAAATSPGWSGIPYCVPVMQTLFRQLAKGGGWPSCPEANVSGPGYEPFKACPAGLSPAQAGSDGTTGVTPSPNGNLCVDLSPPRQTCSAGDASCAQDLQATPREQRSDPYFVDITTANGPQLFYFSVQGN